MVSIGCSAVQSADKSAQDVYSSADEVENRMQRIGELSDSSAQRFEARGDKDGIAEQSEIQQHAADTSSDMLQVKDQIDSIRRNLLDVEDKTSAFERIINKITVIGIVVSALGGVGLLLYLGYASGVLPLVLRFSRSILRVLTPEDRVGVVLEKLEDPNDSMTSDQAVAAIRGIDSDVDIAFKRSRAKRDAERAKSSIPLKDDPT